MVRRLLAGLLGSALLALTGLPSAAQEKKDAPKKKEVIAVNDPEKAKADPDFAIQGEYLGEVVLNSGPKPFAAQVVARGSGDFAVKLIPGGLPGDGGDEMAALRAAAKRGADGSAAIAGANLSGSIGNGTLTVKDGMKIDATLKKVDRKSPTLGLKPPPGAVVLFGKPGDETNWTGGPLVELPDGKFLGVGGVTKQAVSAFRMHAEFRLPWMPNSTGQGRGNSGVYIQRRYELQVLDSFGLAGSANECGAIYTQTKPRVNMCLPPLSWQTYDIDFTPAAFDADGKKTTNARITLVHNGVKVHDAAEVKGTTGGGQPEKPTPGPILFQNHRSPVVYNNVWLVEVK